MHTRKLKAYAFGRQSKDIRLDDYMRPVFTAGADERVREVRRRLGELDSTQHGVDRIAVVDSVGGLVADLSVLELSTASPYTTLSKLAPPARVPEVQLDEEFSEAVWALLETRQGSIVVVDHDGRPIGRLLATDVVTALQRHRRSA